MGFGARVATCPNSARMVLMSRIFRLTSLSEPIHTSGDFSCSNAPKTYGISPNGNEIQTAPAVDKSRLALIPFRKAPRYGILSVAKGCYPFRKVATPVRIVPSCEPSSVPGKTVPSPADRKSVKASTAVSARLTLSPVKSASRIAGTRSVYL